MAKKVVVNDAIDDAIDEVFDILLKASGSDSVGNVDHGLTWRTCEQIAAEKGLDAEAILNRYQVRLGLG